MSHLPLSESVSSVDFWPLFSRSHCLTALSVSSQNISYMHIAVGIWYIDFMKTTDRSVSILAGYSFIHRNIFVSFGCAI